MTAIQVLCRHRHLGYSMLFIDFCDPTSGIGCETVGLVQIILYIHCDVFGFGCKSTHFLPING